MGIRDSSAVSIGVTVGLGLYQGSSPATEKIEYQVCGDKYTISLEDRKNIRSFLTTVEEHRK